MTKKYSRECFQALVIGILVLTIAACGVTAKKTGAKKDKGTIPVYTLSFKINNSTAGRVEGSPFKAQYPAGTKVTLEAIASSGWEFDKWSGTYYYDPSHPEYKKDKITLSIDKNIFMVAHFKPDDTINNRTEETISITADKGKVVQAVFKKKP